jgi:AraC-like DNA-binding protein
MPRASDEETALRAHTSYERRDHGPGLVSWVYEYWNPRPLRKDDGMGAGLEIGVQLAGEWLQTGARHGKRLYGPGQVHRIDPGELYELSFASPSGRGVQVGFIVYPEEIGGLHGPDEELRFRLDDGSAAPELVELCRDYHAAAPRAPLRDDQVRAVLVRYVRRHCEIAPRDPVLMGKREIERFFDRELKIEHIAEAAAMHPITFARRFARRYGVTPITYRLRVRLNHAARLTWTRPDLSIAEIAHESGFNDLAFFHRRFLDVFGMTPSRYGFRACRDERSCTQMRAAG